MKMWSDRKKRSDKKIKKTELLQEKKKKKPLVAYHLVVSITRLTFTQTFLEASVVVELSTLKICGEKNLCILFCE